jgi:hypothetical protein
MAWGWIVLISVLIVFFILWLINIREEADKPKVVEYVLVS